METPQETSMLKFLIGRSSHPENVLRFFSKKSAKTLSELPSCHSTSTRFLTATGWLKSIHYSWFHPIFETYPKAHQSLFFSLLTSEQLEGLQRMLKTTEMPKTAPPFLIPYLSSQLKEEFLDEGILPEELLPVSELILLLDLDRTQLLETIDLLGIHDLATELKQIVDRDLLGKIYQALSKKQLQFLHYSSKLPSRWVSPKMGLAGWDGTKKSLNLLTHQRGLIRMARAIFQEHPSFIWHLLHRLDTGRAHVIQKVLNERQELSLTGYFKSQVLHIAQRYQGISS